ncbi:hypothetical protein [Mycolicibacterium porcinum]|uniref:Transposase n=2 Tax=Mycolicibacterium porcinum TaxID=39693 RepID=A0ABV3VI47_9MYCO
MRRGGRHRANPTSRRVVDLQQAIAVDELVAIVDSADSTVEELADAYDTALRAAAGAAA